MTSLQFPTNVPYESTMTTTSDSDCLFPIRCYTCNKVIGRYIQEWDKWINEEKQPIDFFNTFTISRYCCRRIFMCRPPSSIMTSVSGNPKFPSTVTVFEENDTQSRRMYLAR